MVMFLVVLFYFFFAFAPADAAIVAKGKPLSQYNTDNGNTNNGNTDNGNTNNGNTDNGNTNNGNTDNGNTNNGNTDNGNTDNSNTDNGNTDNGNTNNGNQVVSKTFLAGARKVKNEESFKPWGFEVDLTPQFLVQVMNEEGNDRHTDVWIISSSEENINKFKETGESLGLIIRKKKALREKDIPQNFFKELTQPWGEDDPVVGYYIQIVDPSKESAIQKIRSNPLFGFIGGMIPGASAAISLVDLGSRIVK
jgi:hypothetical protein